MKRLHIHVGVQNISDSVKFYNALFGAEPVKAKSDYAKWMLDNPRVNFAISTRSSKIGVDHLGIQVDNNDELGTLRDQLSKANLSTHSDGETTCCYAKSEKSWVEDPSGIAWEAYHTMEDAQVFSEIKTTSEGACCVPEIKSQSIDTSSSVKKSECCG